jgi:lysophospholipase L1-like esterase
VGLLQIEIGTAITPYEAWHLPRTKRENLPPSLKESINGKKWVSYGDSITAQNKWQPSVSSFHELLHTNLGVGSTTMSLIASRETEYPCFVNATRIQAIKDANPDIVTIMGGTNDSHLEAPVGTSAELTKAIESKDKTNFYGAYSFLIETLLTWKPTLKIMLMSTQQGIYDTSRPYKYKDYADATKAIAQFYSLPCADVFGESGISKYNMAAYSTDLIHPNDEGGKLIANVVATTMEKIAKF